MKFVLEVEPSEIGSIVAELLKVIRGGPERIDMTKVETVNLASAVESFIHKPEPTAKPSAAAKPASTSKPKAAASPVKKQGRPFKTDGPTIVQQVTELLSKEPLPSKTIKDRLTALGRNPESIYPVLKAMRDDFLIETRQKENSLDRFNYLLTPEEKAARIAAQAGEDTPRASTATPGE